ncbi:Gfo/Idh/MocA family protein [Clostridium polynesiense]|uniref:Gfo/Idh/MocA family protein n=1 Tax=Clostridium polynesiense TaxID=1325933 RepID=UPI0006950C45|nr:Gfo/Idh/MocA family oxidoreductase [Clostridium polynesiense]
MFRIGIIGSDNSHAEVFSKLINLREEGSGEFLYPDCKVVSIFGLDEQRTREVAKNADIPFILKNPEDMINKVDGVMVVFRHGDLHKEYALPFIKAGIPTWIDKPFTIGVRDAEEILLYAEKYNTLVTGGSTCKYACDVISAKKNVESGNLGRIKTGTINFTANLESEYGGIYFYGVHLLEMALEIFGYGVKFVTASKSSQCVTAVLKYEEYQITLNFIEGLLNYHLNIIGDKRSIYKEFNISKVYHLGLDRFIHMLRTGEQPFPLSNIYSAVKIFNAIVNSYEQRRTIEIL